MVGQPWYAKSLTSDINSLALRRTLDLQFIANDTFAVESQPPPRTPT